MDKTWAKMENAAAMPTAPMPTIDTLLLAFDVPSSATCWKSCSLSPDIFGSGEDVFKKKKWKWEKQQMEIAAAYDIDETRKGRWA